MVERRVIGSWLEGPRALAAADGVDLGHPGQRLGLPRSGPGSVARFGPRLLAFAVDTVVCNLVVLALVAFGVPGERDTLILAVFFAEVLLLSAMAGGSAGQLVVGMRLSGVGRALPLPLAALIRTPLILLLVPPLIWDADQRGLHDRAARTVLLRTR